MSPSSEKNSGSSDAPAMPRGRNLQTRGGKCLHIGCDVCARWFVVDQVLFDHWRNAKFTCCMIGETCSRKELHTSLVAVPSMVPQSFSRLGRPCRQPECRPQVLPNGCWDLWRPNTALTHASPRVFGAPMSSLSADAREEAAQLLSTAFTQEDSQLTIREMLSGKKRPKQKGRKQRQIPHVWLLWQECPETKTMLAVAILTRQVSCKKGPKELQGGMVLEYIGIRPNSSGKAYWLVLAAEEVALLMGHTELFSACDLNQCGQAFPGAKVALEAHRRWGFEDTDQKEWRDRRLEGYSEGCDVHYMVKVIGQ